MKSIVQSRGTVPFANVINEKVYMKEFYQETGLPDNLKHWQPTVDAMLDGIKVTTPIYLMVDQGYVKKSETLRRAGVHIDGHWISASHRMPSRHHVPTSRHKSPTPGHRIPGGHQSPDTGSGHGMPGGHNFSGGLHSLEESYPEAIILASNVMGCVGYVGDYVPNYGKGGDCSAISINHLQKVELQANRAWAGNVGFIHESIPMENDCHRTVVRLNVPGWSP